MHIRNSARIINVLFVCLFILLVASCRKSETTAQKSNLPASGKSLGVAEWSGSAGKAWAEYDKLVSELKYEEASKIAEKILEDAKASKEGEEWVRAIIRNVQLKTALHGYEDSVKFLVAEPWPEDLLANTTLRLFYAETLVNYANAYSWEIRNREKVESKEKVDLKAWTMDEIYAEAMRAFSGIWRDREKLSGFSNTSLAEYITPNNFPKGIRPSLRDTIAYLWTRALTDTSGWRPEQSNEIYQLDLNALLADNGKYANDEKYLTDGSVHPLLKVATILGNLEGWHAGRGEKGAALEARLEKLRIMHENFTDAADRQKITNDLKETLSKAQGDPWWAAGMALLAEFVRDENSGDNLIRAREIAGECYDAYPETVGGKRCLYVMKAIESPDFQIDAMASDSPKKQSIGVKYKNLQKLYFRVYPVDLQKHIESSDDYTPFPGGTELDELLKNQVPSYKWTSDLPAAPDFKMHRLYITPPMDKPGFYVVTASAREDFSEDDNNILAADMIIGDLVLQSRGQEGEAIVQVLSGSTGYPVSGATVYLYRNSWREKHRTAGTKVTDDSGTVRFAESNKSSYFLFAKKGDDIAIDTNYINFYRREKPGKITSSLIYTDRSIYRPLQKIFFKVIAYGGESAQGRFETRPETGLDVILVDANYQTVETKTLKTNGFGTASGEFIIPAGRLLGSWQIKTSIGGEAYIQVEEYKRPTFEAKFLNPETPLRLNNAATIKGEAKYYFGLPVTDAAVKWRVVRSAVYPLWWGYGWLEGLPPSSEEQTVSAGSGALSEDGTFTISFTPEADSRMKKESKDITYRYGVTADVTDEGGETRTATRDFRLGFVAVEAFVQTDRNFFLENSPASFTVVRSDLDGSPAAGDAAWRVTTLEGPEEAVLPADQALPPSASSVEAFHTKDDLVRPRWNPGYDPDKIMRGWKSGDEKAKGVLKHNDKGEAELALPALPAGAYRILYETTDPFGTKYEMSHEFIVAGNETKIPLPALLRVERGSVRAGETARILAVSGLKDQMMFLDIYHDGDLFKRQILESGTSPTLIEIPMREEDRCGFSVTMYALRDHQFMGQTAEIGIPWDNKELAVSFATFRDKLRPGDAEIWSVKVTGPSGKETAVAAAELLAYMYDRSLDAFVSHEPPSPIDLYPHYIPPVRWNTSLGIARAFRIGYRGFAELPDYPSLDGDSPKFLGGYGIGGPGRRHGMVMYDMGPAPMPEAEAPQGAMMAKVVVSEAEGESRAAGARPQKQVELRTDFSETAFWRPHLLTGPDGSATIEFTVPDSVTAWNVWVHAITRDMKSGSITKETKSVKDLMVRPYLPRFLREGDEAELKVVVNNASASAMAGGVTLDIIDPATEKSVLEKFGLSRSDATNRPFTSPTSGGTNVTFPIKTPTGVGMVAFKVTAVAGNLSDGELRPIPILPGRMHLAQSRFVSLKDKEKRTMTFEDMAKNDDPTRISDQLVVTLDAQLFYQVISALPYLVNYPYECTEQLLNRFISTGILSSIYKDYPAIEQMAKKLSGRKTEFEQWDAPDPNRKMALEETPWVIEAKGGDKEAGDLINVLDPRIVAAQQRASLAKLKMVQTSSGAFPWFPGGPPSLYMTLYILASFSKALEFGVDIPQDMIKNAWDYVHRYYIDEMKEEMMDKGCCFELVTFLNYILSSYPDTSWTGGLFSDDERKEMLDFSFKHWKEHSPYLKGLLALTLKRMGRAPDAMLVWGSVLDSAKTEKDQGTFWTAEDRSWLWYNDTIETHAFAIRTTMELMPENEKLPGMVQWIFLNKKLNHWKSTRATAEVIYSLAHYLKKTGQLGAKEAATVTIGDLKKEFVFSPEKFEGKKNQIVIPGTAIDPAKSSTTTVEKESPGYLFASATWHFSTERLPLEARGDFLSVERSYFKREKAGTETILKPLADGVPLKVGDEVEAHISLTSKHPAEYVHLRDPRPAGFEPSSNISRHMWGLGIYWYEEVRDSGTNFFFEELPQGEYTFKYRIRAATAGLFKSAPATVQPMYAPEFAGYSAGAVIKVE